MHPHAASQGQCRPARPTWRDGGLDFDLQARPRRRRRAPVQIRLLQLLPRGSEDVVPGTEAQRSTGGFLGCPGTHALCAHFCHSWRPQLALHLFPSSVLLLWSQPFLLKRVLPALWRQSGRAARLGRKQLRQALQLGLVLQRLPRGTSFSADGPLDPHAGVSRSDYRATTRRRCARDQTASRTRFPRSESAAAHQIGVDARRTAPDLDPGLSDITRRAGSINNESPVGMMRRVSRLVLVSLGGLVCLLATIWAVGALYFDLPIAWLRAPLALIYGGTMLAALIFVKGRGRAMGIMVAGFAVVLGWWFTIKPSNDGNWQPDVAQLAWAEVNGDEVTLHNVRNCDYRTETDYTPRWETRTVRISQITGIDIAINYWGSPWIAHPIVSFQFAAAPPLCFSIETRKRVGQPYSTIGGLYRQYTLIYVVSDERDVIRLRTNYRHENIYLYHLTVSTDRARDRFLEYVRSLNALRAQPRWYNAITTNCTTSIRSQHPSKERIPWDWRILLNGKGDELLYKDGGLVTGGLPFAELKAQSLINDRAKRADTSPDFSQLIRVGLPTRIVQ